MLGGSIQYSNRNITTHCARINANNKKLNNKNFLDLLLTYFDQLYIFKKNLS